MSEPALLSCQDLCVTLGGHEVVNSIFLEIARGELLGLVGESGCGKTTLARCLLGMQRETSGRVYIAGECVSGLPSSEARLKRKAIQYVHQDPGAALDPWWSIGRTLDETLRIFGVTDTAQRTKSIHRIIHAVGLAEEMLGRHPHELSGGQLRRVGLARIMVLEPQIIILDEPTAGLDLSVQASVLQLIQKLRTQLGLTILFISHDLGVVRNLCDRVAVMYQGSIVEVERSRKLFARPQHAYTQTLLGAMQRLDGYG